MLRRLKQVFCQVDKPYWTTHIYCTFGGFHLSSIVFVDLPAMALVAKIFRNIAMFSIFCHLAKMEKKYRQFGYKMLT